MSKNNEEMISIIIPAYNETRTIEAVLRSALNQTIKCEVIVVDDGSTDGTKELVSKYPVKIISTKRQGPGHARNIGVKNANGQIIAFIDADETIESNFIEVCITHFKNPRTAVVFPTEHFVSTNSFWGKCLSVHQEITQLKIHTVPKIVRKSFFLQVGGYDEGLPRLQDEDLRSRMRREAKKHNFLLVEEPRVATYHIEDAENLVDIFRHSILYGRTMIPFTKKYILLGAYGLTLTAAICFVPLSILILFLSLPKYLYYLSAFHVLSYITRSLYLILRGLVMTRNIPLSLCLPLLEAAKAYGYGYGITKYVFSRGKILDAVK